MNSEYPQQPVPPDPVPVQPAVQPQQGSGSDDKLWMVGAHLSFFIAGFIVPLAIWLAKKDDASSEVADHAREALNFHLSLLLYYLICIPLVFILIGFFLILGIMIMGGVFAVVAAIQASDGKMYRYPLCIRFIS